MACIVVERLTIQPGMTEAKKELVATADVGLGVLGVLIAYTGYVRATATEKGFDFYAHEPVFWLKICLVGIFGAGRSRLYVAQRRGLRPSLAQCFISKCLLLCPLGLLTKRCHRG